MSGYSVYLKTISRMQSVPTMPKADSGQAFSAKARASKQRRSCDDCLWNWQNVHTGEGRVCYHNTSPRYHQPAGGPSCFAFESRVDEEMLAAFGKEDKE